MQLAYAILVQLLCVSISVYYEFESYHSMIREAGMQVTTVPAHTPMMQYCHPHYQVKASYHAVSACETIHLLIVLASIVVGRHA